MSTPDISDFARRQILAVSQKTLRQAGVEGTLPTPIDVVAAAAGIIEIVDIGDLPADLAARKPPAWKRILGAIQFRERIIFVDRVQPSSRVLFTQAHETGHQIIPWHQQSYELDNEDGLFKNTKELLDLEANLAAAHLIFQGQRFFDQALDFEISLKAPIALAPIHGASFHAAIRYYAEHHPDPIALIVTGRYPSDDGSLPIWTRVDSPSFRAKFGGLTSLFPQQRLVTSPERDRLLGDLAHASLKADTVDSMEINLSDLNGNQHDFLAEAFFNSHCVFILVSPRKAFRLGRRVQLEAG